MTPSIWRAAPCLVLVTALVALAPTGASAQELSDRSLRVAANGAFGFAGELDSYATTGSTTIRGDLGLDPTFGFDLRVELPVLDFLVVGGLFELLGVDESSASSAREEYFAFDLYARVRWVFEIVPGELFLEPYGALPVGFSMAVLPRTTSSGDEVRPGWNIGALGGAALIHASGFGGYLEMGWRHAEVYGEQSTLLGTVKGSLVMNELALNVGFLYAFDQ